MPTNLYGPGDNFDLESSHVLPAMIRKFVEATDHDRQEVHLWGSGKPRREFLHVDDLASAVLMALDRYDDDQILNVGTGIDLTINELAEKVAQIAGFSGELIWDSSKPDGTPRKLLDVSRVMAMGWKPQISLDQGIRETMTWYREINLKGGHS